MIQFVTAIIVARLLSAPGSTSDLEAVQSKPTAAAKPPLRACTLLTKQEVRKLAGTDDQFFDMVTPREETVSASGSACFYSGITIQLDPFTPAALEDHRQKKGAQWQVVNGVADTAYFFDNNNPGASLHYAELYAVVGTRVFTIQMSVRPPEASADTVRPELLALAKALAAKLRR